jgi:hypothetical protein
MGPYTVACTFWISAQSYVPLLHCCSCHKSCASARIQACLVQLLCWHYLWPFMSLATPSVSKSHMMM